MKYGEFPYSLDESRCYDVLVMFALFPHFENYKEILLAMNNYSKKFITFNGSFKLTGQTIADRDISYFFYLDSGGRLPLVVHNIYELINYLCTELFNVKSIKFFGYHIKEKSYICYPMSKNELIKGNFVIELHDKKYKPKRVGGVGEGDPLLENAFFPQIEITVDDERIEY